MVELDFQMDIRNLELIKYSCAYFLICNKMTLHVWVGGYKILVLHHILIEFKTFKH